MPDWKVSIGTEDLDHDSFTQGKSSTLIPEPGVIPKDRQALVWRENYPLSYDITTGDGSTYRYSNDSALRTEVPLGVALEDRPPAGTKWINPQILTPVIPGSVTITATGADGNALTISDVPLKDPKDNTGMFTGDISEAPPPILLKDGVSEVPQNVLDYTAGNFLFTLSQPTKAGTPVTISYKYTGLRLEDCCDDGTILEESRCALRLMSNRSLNDIADQPVAGQEEGTREVTNWFSDIGPKQLESCTGALVSQIYMPLDTATVISRAVGPYSTLEEACEKGFSQTPPADPNFAAVFSSLPQPFFLQGFGPEVWQGFGAGGMAGTPTLSFPILELKKNPTSGQPSVGNLVLDIYYNSVEDIDLYQYVIELPSGGAVLSATDTQGKTITITSAGTAYTIQGVGGNGPHVNGINQLLGTATLNASAWADYEDYEILNLPENWNQDFANLKIPNKILRSTAATDPQGFLIRNGVESTGIPVLPQVGNDPLYSFYYIYDMCEEREFRLSDRTTDDLPEGETTHYHTPERVTEIIEDTFTAGDGTRITTTGSHSGGDFDVSVDIELSDVFTSDGILVRDIGGTFAVSNDVTIDSSGDIGVTGDLTIGGTLTVGSGVNFTETDPIFTAHAASGVTAIKITNWDTSYTHSQTTHAPSNADRTSTNETSHTDVVVDGDFASTGLMKRGSSAGSYSIVTDGSANWNTSYGWGNHASAGYSTLALGETSSTAYRGDRGKTGYDHSQTGHAPSNATVNDTDSNLKNRANHTGTQTASTISDFDTEVGNHNDVSSNTTHSGSAHAPTGAEANVNPDWNSSSGDSEILNKPALLALGETNSTAYRGDRGKTGYDHSQTGHAPSNSDNTAANQTSHADVVVDGDFSATGLMKRGGSAGSYSTVTDSSANWNTAYGWGNHGSAGYLTAIGNEDLTDLSDVAAVSSGTDGKILYYDHATTSFKWKVDTDTDTHLSDSQVKTAYENNADSNEYSDTEQTKLGGVATGATANSSDATLKNRANHTGTQTASTVSDFDTEVGNHTDVTGNTGARHSQNTDTGTASSTFQLNTTATGTIITGYASKNMKIDGGFYPGSPSGHQTGLLRWNSTLERFEGGDGNSNWKPVGAPPKVKISGHQFFSNLATSSGTMITRGNASSPPYLSPSESYSSIYDDAAIRGSTVDHARGMIITEFVADTPTQIHEVTFSVMEDITRNFVDDYYLYLWKFTPTVGTQSGASPVAITSVLDNASRGYVTVAMASNTVTGYQAATSGYNTSATALLAAGERLFISLSMDQITAGVHDAFHFTVDITTVW